MATGKKGFMLYADMGSLFAQLSDDQAGQLIKHIFSYVNDEDPEAPNQLISIAFEPIKQTLKRDLRKWEERAKRSRKNGKKGGRPKKPTETQPNPQEPTGFSGNPQEPKKPDSVSVSVTDSDSVSDKKNIEGIAETSSATPTTTELALTPEEKEAQQIAEIKRRRAVSKRNQKLVDGVKDSLRLAKMAYKKHPKHEKNRANLFFRSTDFAVVAKQYGLTPGKFALMLCDGAMGHKYWKGRITNTVDLYDNRAKIHNDCMSSFQKKNGWKSGL